VGWDEDDGHFSAGTVANWEAAGMRTSGIESLQPPSIDAPVLAEIVRRLAEAYRPERIYLFGSTARGDAGPDSDYDLMIIVREDTPSYLRSEDLAYRVLRGTGTAADVLVWTRNNFDRQLHLKASLPSTVIREGKLLYGAG
jgi:predicted nucleotidyltransferase